MSDEKPNILGKLPVYNDAGEIFEAGSDKVQFAHKIQRTSDYARSSSQATTEQRTKRTKRTTRRTASQGSDPGIGRSSRPSYKYGGGKSASDKGSGTAKGGKGKK